MGMKKRGKSAETVILLPFLLGGRLRVTLFVFQNLGQHFFNMRLDAGVIVDVFPVGMLVVDVLLGVAHGVGGVVIGGVGGFALLAEAVFDGTLERLFII